MFVKCLGIAIPWVTFLIAVCIRLVRCFSVNLDDTNISILFSRNYVLLTYNKLFQDKLHC